MGININFYVSGLETTGQRAAFAEYVEESDLHDYLTVHHDYLTVYSDDEPLVIVRSSLRYLSGEKWDGRGESWPLVCEQARLVVKAAQAVNPAARVQYGHDALEVLESTALARANLPVVDDAWFEQMDDAHADPAMLINDGRAGSWNIRTYDFREDLPVHRVEDDGPLLITLHDRLWLVYTMGFFTDSEHHLGIAEGERVKFQLADPDCDDLSCDGCSQEVVLDIHAIREAPSTPTPRRSR